VRWRLVLAGFAALPLLAQTGTGDERFLRKSNIRVERILSTLPSISQADPKAGGPPRFSPISLSESEIKLLRSVLLSALRRNRAEEAEAKRRGQYTGGVGCLTREYHVDFELDGAREVAVLHLAGGWLSGGPRVGNIVFSGKEKRRLENLLGWSRPCG
jgi:hypothetical protein